jgi:hypothetical protein
VQRYRNFEEPQNKTAYFSLLEKNLHLFLPFKMKVFLRYTTLLLAALMAVAGGMCHRRPLLQVEDGVSQEALPSIRATEKGRTA